MDIHMGTQATGTHMDTTMGTHMDITMGTHMGTTMYIITATLTVLDRHRSCKVGHSMAGPSSSLEMVFWFLRSLPTHPGRHTGQCRSYHLLHSYSDFR